MSNVIVSPGPSDQAPAVLTGPGGRQPVEE